MMAAGMKMGEQKAQQQMQAQANQQAAVEQAKQEGAAQAQAAALPRQRWYGRCNHCPAEKTGRTS